MFFLILTEFSMVIVLEGKSTFSPYKLFHSLTLSATLRLWDDEGNTHLKNVVNQTRKRTAGTEETKRTIGTRQRCVCRKVLRELSENITTLSNANDVQGIELEKFREKEREQHSARVWKQAEERNTKRAVCRAFGWKHATATASATLVRAGTQRNAM